MSLSTRWRPPSRWHVVSCGVVVTSLGCTEPRHDDFTPESALTSDDGPVVPFPDEGVVAHFDPASGTPRPLEIGGQPTRVARMGDRWVVTLRAERALAVLALDRGALVEVDRVATGSEPLGIVARADGARAWVALSTQDEVVELDGALEPVRTFAVPGRPSWLALHPSGEALYVAAAVGGGVSWVDLTADDPTPAPVEFPTLIGASRTGDAPFARRLTGDPAFDEDGTRLAIPGLWVDDVSAPGGRHGDQAAKYATLGLGLSPNNPGIALLDVDASGRPATAVDTVLYGEAWSAVHEDEVVRGYLSSVRFADGRLLATAESSDHVLVLDPTPTRWATGLGGFTVAPTVAVSVPGGPRRVEIAPDGGLWVQAFLDRALTPVDLDTLGAALDALAPGTVSEEPFAAGSAVPLTDARLDPQIELGRSLFYAANNPRITLPSTGLSCSACHFEGRNDGMTWPVDTGTFQTPALAGRISLTTPVTWVAQVPTVAEEARLTSQERLGGVGGTAADFAAIAAYLDASPEIDHPTKGASTEATERGRLLFERPDAGCARCHSGERYTDRRAHAMFELDAVDTPALVGIAATAPYFHDGHAATLRDVLEETRTGAMGDTSAFTDAELADLEAFLRTL
jgi:hypothetical protein